MELEKNHEHISELIETFLKALHIEGSIDIVPITEKKFSLKINTQDGQGYLIGKQGSTLEALQHLLTLIARKENLDIQYRVDVNNYQEERNEIFLKRVADYISEKSESTEILLWPMTPYERKLVHEYFLTAGTHTTESEDFGSKRVIRVIKK